MGRQARRLASVEHTGTDDLLFLVAARQSLDRERQQTAGRSAPWSLAERGKNKS
jgi:hypothetical protein